MPTVRDTLLQRFRRVRARTESLLAPLADEDYRIQSMPDVSPPWWNLAHTSWFFVANVLRPASAAFPDFPGFDYAANSYYEGLGPRLPRDRRGRIAQPETAAVLAYRSAVDAAMQRAIAECPAAAWSAFATAAAIGLQHEQQHQELFCTEILHILSGRGLFVVGAYIGRFAPGNLFLLGSGLPHMLCGDPATSDASEPTHIRYAQFKRENFGDAFWQMPE